MRPGAKGGKGDLYKGRILDAWFMLDALLIIIININNNNLY